MSVEEDVWSRVGSNEVTLSGNVVGLHEEGGLESLILCKGQW